jgi:hypothetical protein
MNGIDVYLSGGGRRHERRVDVTNGSFRHMKSVGVNEAI